METFEEVKSKQARELCRSVLWIDDELDKIGTKDLKPLFVQVLQGFSGNGILCHLKDYPVGSGEDYSDDPDRAMIYKLAESADFVIMDWQLGSSDDSSEAQEIIKHILSLKGLRYIAVVSQDTKIVEHFEKAFIANETFAKHGDSGYATGSGQFATVLVKPADGAVADFPKKLIEAMHALIQNSYSDYLHWAGIELTTKLREVTPKLLGALPEDTDIALLSTYANTQQESGNQLQEMVVKSVMDDLGRLIGNSTLSAFSSMNPKEEIKKRIDDLVEQNLPSEDELRKNLVNQLVNFEQKGKPKALINACKKFKGGSNNKVYDSVTNAVVKFGSFCETVTSFDDISFYINTGCLVKTTAEGSEWDYAVCISPACDCARDAYLLFAVGKLEGHSLGERAVARITRHDVNKLDLSFEASNIIRLKVDRSTEPSIEDAEIIGMLRERFANRLVNRIWANLTRVGTDSAYAKTQLRGEVCCPDAK